VLIEVLALHGQIVQQLLVKVGALAGEALELFFQRTD
jgi:hypothetical protein